MKKDYMIKSINSDFTAYNGFKYPQQKGALVEAPDWNPKPECGGGIHGTVGWTKKKYIQNNDLWIILEYIKEEAVVINDEKIKVPRAWVVDWGSAEKIQRVWEELTNYKYEFDYAIQIAGDKSAQTAGSNSIQIAKWKSTQTAEWESTQIAENNSVQMAGWRSIQTAGNESTQTASINSTQIAGWGSIQTAGNMSTQTAGDNSTQTAGWGSIQAAGCESTQTAEDNSVQIAEWRSMQTAGWKSTQIAEDNSVQTAGWGSTQTAGRESVQTAKNNSTQTAGWGSTQTAGNGSVSIIRGKIGYCQHKGKVLQILCFYDYNENDFVFLTKIINDTHKHKLTAIKKNSEWVLEDEIIENVENDSRD